VISVCTPPPSSTPGRFDRFATAAAGLAARAWFFSLCLLLVVLWIPSILFFSTVDTWQLVINTATTIVTFLLVSLFQNTQHRADRAVQSKLNAIAEGVADLMEAHRSDDPSMAQDVEELRKAVGLEHREGT
jgi:low affinity Fe/Cu permease